MLPEMDGFSVCKAIRAESAVPIIMLTARGEVADKVIGLELGADDYLAKPFEPRELVARIHAVLRRRAPASDAQKAVLGDLDTILNGAWRGCRVVPSSSPPTSLPRWRSLCGTPARCSRAIKSCRSCAASIATPSIDRWT